MIPIKNGSKIDIHAMRPGPVLDWLATLAAQGVTFPVVKAVDDMDWLVQVKASYPAVTTIGRITSQYEGCQGVGEPGANLERMTNDLIGVIQAKIAANPALKTAVDFWEVCNEPDPPGVWGYHWLSLLMKLCMVKAEDIGIKLGIFALNNGTPEWKEVVAMVATDVFEVAKQGGHIMTVHEGVFGDDPIDKWWGGSIPDAPHVPGAGALCFRYRYLYSLLKGLDQVVPLVVTEFYAGGVYDDGAAVLERVEWYDEKSKDDWYHLGECLFSVSPVRGWEQQNYEPAYPALMDYMVRVKDRQNAVSPVPPTVPPITPPPTQPPAGTLNQRLWGASVAEQIARGVPLNPNAALQQAIFAAGLTPVHREISSEGYVIQAGEDVTGQKPRRVFVWKAGQAITSFTDPAAAPVDPPIPPTFALASPVKGIPLFVTDWFNVPRDYAGNHEGIDLKGVNAAGLPVPIIAAAAGIVDGIRAADPGTGYGIYVRLRHERPGVVYKSWYCHLSRVASGLAVGQAVEVGRELGTAGSTGTSTGVHLHLTVQKIPGGLPGFVIDSVVDPAPLLGLVPPTTPHTVDLLPYLRGDGRIYTVRHPDGNQEDFQTQSEGSVFYQVKNSQYEALKHDSQWIYRGLDSSPGPAPNNAERPGELRFYIQFEFGHQWAKWCPRYMTVGESWTGPGHYVQFRYKSDCAPCAINTGSATNKATLVAKHASKTWNGVRVDDVIELKSSTGEIFYFAKNYGLVAWGADWGSSGIVEVSPPGRPPLERERIACL